MLHKSETFNYFFSYAITVPKGSDLGNKLSHTYGFLINDSVDCLLMYDVACEISHQIIYKITGCMCHLGKSQPT